VKLEALGIEKAAMEVECGTLRARVSAGDAHTDEVFQKGESKSRSLELFNEALQDETKSLTLTLTLTLTLIGGASR